MLQIPHLNITARLVSMGRINLRYPVVYVVNISKPERCVSFDLSGYPTLSQDAMKTHISILNFESILQYVDIPKISHLDDTVKPNTQMSTRNQVPPQAGGGRTEVEEVFQKLRDKGVSTILKVNVDDLEYPAHNDAAIERSLKNMSVEVWNWRKIDICPSLIFQTAPDITEVHLYWSGTNAVLRAWSEEEGLPMMKKLNKIFLHELQVSTRIDTISYDPQRPLHFVSTSLYTSSVARRGFH